MIIGVVGKANVCLIILLTLMILLTACMQSSSLDKINTIEEFEIYLNESHLQYCESASDCTVMFSDCSRPGRCEEHCDKLVTINRKYYPNLNEVRNHVCSDFWNKIDTRNDSKNYYLLYDCLYDSRNCYEKLICVNNTCEIMPLNETKKAEEIRKTLQELSKNLEKNEE